MEIFGHRGARGRAPENTIDGLRKALDLCVDGVEFDVRRCGTGELVLFHDRQLKTITDIDGYVDCTSLERLRRARVLGSSRIATLDEALGFLAGRTRVNIEIKTPDIVHATVNAIHEQMEKGNLSYETVDVSSFCHEVLPAVHRRDPHIRLGALFEEGCCRRRWTLRSPINWSLVEEMPYLASINMPVRYIDGPFVRRAHAIGKEVYAWTVSDTRDIAAMAFYGVERIISDYPDIARTVLRQW